MTFGSAGVFEPAWADPVFRYGWLGCGAGCAGLGAWLRALMLPLQFRVEDSGRCGKVAERPYALQGDEANVGAAMVMVMVMVMRVR